MDGMGGAEQWSSPSSPSSHQKRPAGRTKFKETRHPVYRGVRRRGSAGRWVCEVRVPGKRGERLWLGTYVTAEAAARGHDAAMLALGGGSELCLNFADSARLLAVPSGLADLAAVRRAALAAVADFQRREAAYCAETIPGPADEVDTSSALDELFELPATAVLGSDMYDFELDMSGEMDLGSYYADFAEGMLLDPPPPHESTEACWDGGADCAALWSHY
ncbi:dehydration-responsive element-binding protein 1H-like [Lolium rigidum]|uniref:dehydration-responsive element-binding protein 1H-like n=1 Tax=Lolium rigidum TaxID=89674 RepID=UPI001F5C26F3|nr:dehydration-responsive element-binding protein 1H-like [Lolium rigidum]